MGLDEDAQLLQIESSPHTITTVCWNGHCSTANCHCSNVGPLHTALDTEGLSEDTLGRQKSPLSISPHPKTVQWSQGDDGGGHQRQLAVASRAWTPGPGLQALDSRPWTPGPGVHSRPWGPGPGVQPRPNHTSASQPMLHEGDGERPCGLGRGWPTKRCTGHRRSYDCSPADPQPNQPLTALPPQC